MTQREIKFRAWDKNNKKFLTDFIDWAVSPDGGLVWPLEGNTSEVDEDFILMQFTGLKDKNGKEIYEGDVVAIPLQWGKPSPAICEVIFEEGAFKASSVRQYEIQGKGKRWLTLDLDEAEVIGNIYENPELL